MTLFVGMVVGDCTRSKMSHLVFRGVTKHLLEHVSIAVFTLRV